VRLITFCLALLLILIQLPRWFGKGGWLRVIDLDAQVEVAQEKNAGLKARNAKLAAEVADLKDGVEIVEERARRETNMIKQDEFYVHILKASATPATPAPIAP
jgi:cell division protein FtsB